MAITTWVRDELRQRGVAYQERHHDAAYTAQQMAQMEHISGHRVAKVVWLMADDRLIEVVVPASRRVLLERVRQLLGAEHIRLATADEKRGRLAVCEVGDARPLRPMLAIRS